MKKRRRLTGYFDATGLPIREGSILRTGMRRGDPKGWTTERVVWLPKSKEWGLADLKTGERMQFQYDQQLRFLVKA